MKTEIHKATGREIAEIIEVAASGGTFGIVRAYEKEAKARGLTMGSMARSMPRGLVHESKCACISKWYNLAQSDYGLLDGVVECTDNRNGKIARIIIFKKV